MNYSKRVCVLYFSILLCASILLARLYNLSRPEINKSISVLEGQYTGKIDVCERSGFVYDRNGFLLSHDVIGKIALVNPAECENAPESAEILSKCATSLTCSDVYEKLIDGVPFTMTLSKEITADNISQGVKVFDLYEENMSVACHFMGYSNRDGKAMSGLRLEYEDFLQGELYSKVLARFDTNAKKKSLSEFELDEQNYMSTDGVVTTIDKQIQILCDTMANEIRSGAIVVSDIKSGEILATSSFPGYEVENIVNLLDSDKGELVNRAAMSFTPGSVFKILVAASALEIDAELYNLKYTCEGDIKAGDGVFHCHNRAGHGEIDMAEAFSESCNTYFINLGRHIGLDTIVETMKKLGLDMATEAGVLREQANFFPDTENHTEGYISNISFGQGDLCLSLLDMTKIVISAVNGYVPTLSTVKGIVEKGIFNAMESKKNRRIFNDDTCEKMRFMMEKCVKEGTGQKAASEKVKCGGKTATAQTGRFDTQGVEYVHKWFCGVYPIENPRICICVLCDDVSGTNVSPSVIFSEICSFLWENGY